MEKPKLSPVKKIDVAVPVALGSAALKSEKNADDSRYKRHGDHYISDFRMGHSMSVGAGIS